MSSSRAGETIVEGNLYYIRSLVRDSLRAYTKIFLRLFGSIGALARRAENSMLKSILDISNILPPSLSTLCRSSLERVFSFTLFLFFLSQQLSLFFIRKEHSFERSRILPFGNAPRRGLSLATF